MYLFLANKIMARNFLKSSLQNASFNIIFQILCRCVTFGLNAFVLRHVSPAVVGVMNVRLLLLESTILFLSREAFRRACLSKTTEHNWAQVINLLWLTVPLCQVLCLVFGYVWLYVLTPPTEDITQHYVLGVWAICISCIIEMCCEPLHLVSQAFLFVRLKVVLDSIHIAVRTVTFTLLVIHNPQEAVVAFSVAQVLAVCVFVLSHYMYFYHYIKQLRHRHVARQKRENSDSQPASVKLLFVRRDSLTEAEDEFPFESLSDFLPAWLNNEPCIDPGLAQLTWSFFKQGILKQVLTEGERYVMTLFSVLTFAEQGVYDVVNNLSSLAARFLFRPVEDSSYFYFSQMISREASISEQDQKHMAESVRVLHHVLRCITCVGLVILVFGQSYSRLLLYLYGGAGLAEGVGPTLMSTQCLAVLLLAVNGVTECYTFATMSTVQLDRYNYLMAVLSVVFLVLSWGLTRLLGAVGFILANCCNMAARIAHSVMFIGERYQGTEYKPLSGLVPGRCFLSILVVTALCTKLSEIQFYEEHKFVHVFIGGAFFAMLCGAWLYEEHELVGLALQRWRQQKPVDKQH